MVQYGSTSANRICRCSLLCDFPRQCTGGHLPDGGRPPGFSRYSCKRRGEIQLALSRLLSAGQPLSSHRRDPSSQLVLGDAAIKRGLYANLQSRPPKIGACIPGPIQGNTCGKRKPAAGVLPLCGEIAGTGRPGRKTGRVEVEQLYKYGLGRQGACVLDRRLGVGSVCRETNYSPAEILPIRC